MPHVIVKLWPGKSEQQNTTCGGLDPFDVLGLPDFVPRFTRLGVRHVLRAFYEALSAAIAPLARFVETRKPLLGVTHPPLRRRAGCTSNRPSDRSARHAVRRQQHNPRPLPQPVLRLRRTRQALKLRTLLRHQNDNRRFRDASHASLNHNSFISDSGY